uniref:Uncharacterized protein n=1 Tax=Romanomermis culicivorax TaxID=13658 RepID=A0A915LBJ0_ROMCU
LLIFLSLLPTSSGFLLPFLAYLQSDSSISNTTFNANYTSSSAGFSATISSADDENTQNASFLNINETKINVFYTPPIQNGENYTTDLIKYFTSSENGGVSSSFGLPGTASKNPTLAPLYEANFTFYGNDTLNETEAQNFS